ncbi:MAG TPA: hypothetical protein DDW54_01595 [Clostridiales bacterium]|nr:hypothetical protein [Clostridiales bacterium]
MKIYKITKAVLYIAAAIAIFILHETVMPYVGYLVGGVIFAYSVEELIIAAVKRELIGKGGELFPVISQILIGVLLILSSEYIERVCVIWGVWSILREAKELTHAITCLTQKRPGLLNAAESVTIIVMSSLMVLTPTEHHAHMHVILLGIELICIVLFTATEDLYDIFTERKRTAKTETVEIGNADGEEVAATAEENIASEKENTETDGEGAV